MFYQAVAPTVGNINNPGLESGSNGKKTEINLVIAVVRASSPQSAGQCTRHGPRDKSGIAVFDCPYCFLLVRFLLDFQ